jgi:2,3-bisphosphoglycerate-dependent phosphoglycerate mutase
MREIILLRHAAASGQEPDASLTGDGRRQAHQLAGLLSDYHVERVISSPFTRATASIAPLCDRAELRVETDDRLVERVLSGQPMRDWRDHLRRSFHDPDYCLEGGESARVAQARGIAVLESAVASGARCVLVTHGNLLTLMLNSIDAGVGFDIWSRLSNPDVFLIDVEHDRPTGFRRIWG